jgi:hypothetical protein
LDIIPVGLIPTNNRDLQMKKNFEVNSFDSSPDFAKMRQKSAKKCGELRILQFSADMHPKKFSDECFSILQISDY